jgi:hypothetical protein
MTTYSPIHPTLTGADAGPAKAAAASDKIDAVQKLLLVIENASGSSITCTLEDQNSQLPLGAAASSTFADVVITVPANDRVASLVTDTSRFRDSSGLINLTWSSTTTVTWNAYDVA